MEWSNVVTIVLTALSTGGLLAAVFTYLLNRREAQHKAERENRSDATTVLSEIIQDLRNRVERLEADAVTHREAYDKDIRDLRDKHTACLQREGHLEGRIAVLEGEAAERRGGGP